MEAPVPTSSAWTHADDILLKNSIEDGASFEALSKGAVQFSRRFTFQEVRERWHSLLYDPDISAQASPHMVERRLPGSHPSPRFSWLSKSGEATDKRKIRSIRTEYNAMRKRLRVELLNTTDRSFFDETNLHNCERRAGDFLEHVNLDNRLPDSNCMREDCILDRCGLQDSDFNAPTSDFPKEGGNINASNVAYNTCDGFEIDYQNLVVDNHSIENVRRDSLHGFPVDIPPMKEDDMRGLCESYNDQKDASHIMTDHSFNCGKCTNAENVSPSQELTDLKHFENDASEMKRLSTLDFLSSSPENYCSEFADDSEMKRLSTLDFLKSSPQNFGYEFGGRHISSQGSDDGAPLPRLPLWKIKEDISVSSMQDDTSNGIRTQVAEEILTIPDSNGNRKHDSSGYDVVHSNHSLGDRVSGACFVSVAVSEGDVAYADSLLNFPDDPDSLLNFPDEDEQLFMDVDGEDNMKSSFDDFSSASTGSPSDAQIGGGSCNLLDDVPQSVDHSDINLASTPVLHSDSVKLNEEFPCCVLNTEDTSGLYNLLDDVQESVGHSDINLASMPVMLSDSVKLNEEFPCCVLNTEDTEIPCNDDVFLVIHPTAPFASAREFINMDFIDSASPANEKDDEECVNLLGKEKDPAVFCARSAVTGPSMPELYPVPHAGCSELFNRNCLNLLPGGLDQDLRDPSQCRPTHATPVTTAIKVKEDDVVKVETRVVDNASTARELALHAEADSGKVALPESAIDPSISPQDVALPESTVDPSISRQDELDSDEEVPYFSDVEAMLLDMDLDVHVQDSYTSRRVSRCCDDDAKSTIIRLEQCARSSLQRTLSSHGALAFLFGRRLKHYIRKPEVLLGRSTDIFDVDIDLRKESRAKTISRRQALIKLESDGSFFLKNLGKYRILVNGKAVDSGELQRLSSSCLIEIKGMSFVFEINDEYVRSYLDNLTEKEEP